MILTSNTLKTNVTEFIFLLEKPSLQSGYIGKVGCSLILKGAATIILSVFVTPLCKEALKPIGHTFKCPQCWQNCL